MPDIVTRARRDVTLRVGLGAAVSLLVAIAVGLVSWITFVNTRASILAQTHERVDALLRELARQVDAHLAAAVPAVELSRMLTRDGLVRRDADSLARQFTLVLRNNPSFSWVSYSDAAGTFTGAYRTPEGTLSVSQSTFDARGGELREYTVGEGGEWTPSLHQVDYGYDPRVDRFYTAARAARARVWVGPYVFFDEGVPGVTCATPYFGPDGELRGVFTVDFDLNALSDFVRALPFGEHGRVFVLTPEGSVVAHPTVRVVQVTGQGSRGALVTVANAGDDVLRAWFDAANRSNPGAASTNFTFEFENRRFIGGRRTVAIDQQVSWLVGAAAPESDFLGLLARNRLVALVVLLGGLAFGVVVSLVLARRISAPLASLATEMTQVGQFELADRPRLRTRFREVALIDRSLLTMKGSLRSFAYYVPTDLVRAMLASGQEARLEGHTSDLTVFFADIAGFTSIAETMTPAQLVEHMGRYFEAMTDVIRESDGTIDKFIGDAIMAFWGAPTAYADHAARACEAALRCQQALARLRASSETPALAGLHARIGIASGDVLVGNVGTPARFSYTVMGDTVNLASRLESLNKAYGTSVLVAEPTYRAAQPRVVGRPVDLVQVKGKHVGVQIFELLSFAGDDDAGARELAATSEQALTAYLARDFQGALAHFARVRLLRPGDRVAALFEDRCRTYLASPPPADWNGIFVAAEK